MMDKEEVSMIMHQINCLTELAVKHALDNYKGIMLTVNQPMGTLKNLMITYRNHLIESKITKSSLSISLNYAPDALVRDMIEMHIMCCVLAEKILEGKDPDLKKIGVRQTHAMLQFKDFVEKDSSTLDHALEMGGVGIFLRILDLLAKLRKVPDSNLDAFNFEKAAILENLAVSALLMIVCVEPVDVTIEKHKSIIKEPGVVNA